MAEKSTKLSGFQLRNVGLMSLNLFMWTVCYLGSTFYTQFIEHYNLTNTQYGFIMSAFGIVSLVGYLLGGVLADKFRAKRLVVLSIFATTGLAVVMGMAKSYLALIAIFFGFGITIPFMSWTAFLKFVRASGTNEQQGRLFSVFEITITVLNTVANFGLLALMNPIVENWGFGAVSYIYAAILAAIGFAILIFAKDVNTFGNREKSNFKMKDIGRALRHPVTWINGVIILAYYIMGAGVTYFNPYIHELFGLSVGNAVLLILIARYPVRVLVTYLGGKVVDKKGKSTLVNFFCAGLSTVALLALLAMPKSPELAAVAIVLVLLFFIATYFGRVALYTPLAEGGVPMEISGTVSGIVSAIGYSIDVWLYTLCGFMLDNSATSEQGFGKITVLFLAASISLVIASLVFQRYLSRKKMRETEPAGTPVAQAQAGAQAAAD